MAASASIIFLTREAEYGAPFGSSIFWERRRDKAVSMNRESGWSQFRLPAGSHPRGSGEIKETLERMALITDAYILVRVGGPSPPSVHLTAQIIRKSFSKMSMLRSNTATSACLVMNACQCAFPRASYFTSVVWELRIRSNTSAVVSSVAVT